MASEAASGERLEHVSWVLLAAATTASAWCAYQASLWNGEQTKALSKASVAQFAASRQGSIVNRDVIVDVGTYFNYVGATHRGEDKLAAFLRARARPDFKPALEAWIASEASGSVEGPNPLALPEYQIPELKKMTELDDLTRVEIEKANAGNEHSDGYVLHTVLFAISLFFLGATSQYRRRGMRRAMLALGSLVFLLTVISMTRLPRANAGLFEQRHGDRGSEKSR